MDLDLSQLSKDELIREHRRLNDISMRISTRLAVAKAFPNEEGLDERDEQLLLNEDERLVGRMKEIKQELDRRFPDR